MLLVLAVKTLVLGGCMLPIAFGALGTGILFAGYNVALARNPEEVENLFNTTLMGFALMETYLRYLIAKITLSQKNIFENH
jgi:F0F1-type ATP synthase membrane subunit c/vacuolar-type H+-ATPase subunit K